MADAYRTVATRDEYSEEPKPKLPEWAQIVYWPCLYASVAGSSLSCVISGFWSAAFAGLGWAALAWQIAAFCARRRYLRRLAEWERRRR